MGTEGQAKPQHLNQVSGPRWSPQGSTSNILPRPKPSSPPLLTDEEDSEEDEDYHPDHSTDSSDNEESNESDVDQDSSSSNSDSSIEDEEDELPIKDSSFSITPNTPSTQGYMEMLERARACEHEWLDKAERAKKGREEEKRSADALYKSYRIQRGKNRSRGQRLKDRQLRIMQLFAQASQHDPVLKRVSWTDWNSIAQVMDRLEAQGGSDRGVTHEHGYSGPQARTVQRK